MPWSRACVPRPGLGSRSSPTSVSSTTTSKVAGNAPWSSTTARVIPSNFASSPTVIKSQHPTIPTSYASAWARSAGPTAGASATSGWHSGCGSSLASTRSSIVTYPRARKQCGRPTSWPLRSSIGSAHPAANLPWPSTGTPPPAWRSCSASPNSAVTKDRLYRTLDRLLAAQTAIEQDLKDRLGTLFQLDYDLLLYDLTSTYFEGLAAENELACRGYSRDHRGDCKQVILALVVTRDGFPLAHRTLAGNTQDLQTVETIVTEVEQQFGKTKRIWVVDRGMVSKESLAFLKQPGRRYVLAARRGELTAFQSELESGSWQRLPENPEVQVQLICRQREYYLLALSRPRRKKERAIRRRQRHGLARGLHRLDQLIATGRLKSRDKILERVGRLTGRYPKARQFVTITVSKAKRVELRWTWNVAKFKAALCRDGAYLLRSNQSGWSAEALWDTYMQLTVVEHAFRVLKSELLLRPVWHHYSGRTQAHVMVCVLAYALWKTLDHLSKQAGLETEIRKPDPRRPNASPKPRPMTPEVILRTLGSLQIGDILLETTNGRKLA